MMDKVCFVGLGYIGLPTAIITAIETNLKVIGVDINKEVVDNVNKGILHFVEDGLDVLLKRAVGGGDLKALTAAEKSDIYVVVVPTPFKGNQQPDIAYVESATMSVTKLLKEGDLFIIESTSPVGTTERMAELIFKHRPELRGKISIAYCPERVLPGNIVYELVHNDRVIGGIDEQSTTRACEFYAHFVKGELHKTNARTAEMCKLTENSSRDVQIAFANELSIICEKAGIDVWELIALANKHPRVNILQPGCGVGGHCIAVDPYFITAEFPAESQLIGKAREINNYKAFWCAEQIDRALIKFKAEHGRDAKLALMGMAFKPNIDDLRESPAMHIVHKVLQSFSGEEVYVVEPNITSHNIYNLTNYQEAYSGADVIAFLVAHDEFKELVLAPNRESTVVLDFCGVTKQRRH